MKQQQRVLITILFALSFQIQLKAEENLVAALSAPPTAEAANSSGTLLKAIDDIDKANQDIEVEKTEIHDLWKAEKKKPEEEQNKEKLKEWEKQYRELSQQQDENELSKESLERQLQALQGDEKKFKGTTGHPTSFGAGNPEKSASGGGGKEGGMIPMIIPPPPEEKKEEEESQPTTAQAQPSSQPTAPSAADTQKQAAEQNKKTSESVNKLVQNMKQIQATNTANAQAYQAPTPVVPPTPEVMDLSAVGAKLPDPEETKAQNDAISLRGMTSSTTRQVASPKTTTEKMKGTSVSDSFPL